MAAGISVGGGRRGGLPQTAAMMNLLTDLAFNLLIFFLVVADPSTDTGRPQQVPAATSEQTPQEQTQGIQIKLTDPDKTNNRLSLNGDPVTLDEMKPKLEPLLAGKAKPEDRIVVVLSDKDVPYRWWIQVTARIEQAGGIVALQLEEIKEVDVK